MKLDQVLLSVIGRRLQAMQRFPDRPSGGPFWPGRYFEAALNPQPLPPGPPPEVLGAAVADEFTRLAWLSDRFGQDPRRTFDVLDDWCPTVPRGFKRPPGWPPIPEPEPGPDWFVDFHIGFASRIAAATADFGESALGTTLGHAVDRSLQAISAVGAPK